VVDVTGIGTKIKEAAMKAAKEKVSGDGKKGNKDERTGGSESGMDKAMRAVKNRLK
jgi:hypothetical protein